MDKVELISLAAGAAAVLLIAVVIFARPLRGVRRSGDDHESGAWAWIGADNRHDSGSSHSGGSDASGDGGGGN